MMSCTTSNPRREAVRQAALDAEQARRDMAENAERSERARRRQERHDAAVAAVWGQSGSKLAQQACLIATACCITCG